jgi:multidrug transporter EmrE-like cation transporter
VSFIEYFGDSNLKFFARTDNLKYLFYGTGFYMVLIKFIIDILKMSNIIYMNIMWDGTSAILETAMAYILLGERLSNIYQYIGLFITFCGMMLLKIGNIPV